MVLLYFILLALVLVGISYKKSGYYSDYIGKEQSNAIKGIFILLIFCSHVSHYLVDNGYASSSMLDSLFIIVSCHIGQWVVALFLFYSGFGVMESLRKKGEGYLSNYPRKRILTTLLNFDVAVGCFIVLDLMLGVSLSWNKIACSLIGWSSVGNSNWYIFVILVCYLAFYFSYKMSFKDANLGGGFWSSY